MHPWQFASFVACFSMSKIVFVYGNGKCGVNASTHAYYSSTYQDSSAAEWNVIDLEAWRDLVNLRMLEYHQVS